VEWRIALAAFACARKLRRQEDSARTFRRDQASGANSRRRQFASRTCNCISRSATDDEPFHRLHIPKAQARSCRRIAGIQRRQVLSSCNAPRS